MKTLQPTAASRIANKYFFLLSLYSEIQLVQAITFVIKITNNFTAKFNWYKDCVKIDTAN